MSTASGEKIGVLGPGGVGGALAARLARAGHDVVCIATPRTAAAIASEGLTLSWRGETFTTRPRVGERLTEPVSLLLVTVKAYGLAQALGRIEPGAVSGAVVLPLLNGIEHLETIRNALGPRVAAGSTNVVSYQVAPGKVVQETGDLIRMASGELAREELERTAEILRGAGARVSLSDSEEDVLWEKLARMAPAAVLTVVSGETVGVLRSDPVWKEKLVAVLEETCAVARAAGAHTSFAEQWDLIAYKFGDDATTSTARDVASGRPTELDAIAGAVLRAADRLGIGCPTLSELTAEAEQKAAAAIGRSEV
jgi:2-dehydropantoate 2-reductase